MVETRVEFEPKAHPWAAIRKLPIGTEVEITQPNGRTWHGLLVPPHELSGPETVQLKLASGYNVGLQISATDVLTVIARPRRARAAAPSAAAPPPDGPWVALLRTGGTIASRVDYRTGGVSPVADERELLSAFPALDAGGPVRVSSVFERFSEDIVPADWVRLAEHVGAAFRHGARGVVISHGTDTLGFTAAALSFLLENPPGPVVLVGAQRSPDRPSSDGFTNLPAAIHVARTAELAEVVVLMHAGVDDGKFALHRGARVRKMHSSRRDAFQTRNAPPLGFVDGDRIVLDPAARKPTGRPLHVDERLDERAALVWYYPGLTPARFRSAARGLRGLVIAGTGLGHVASANVRWLRRAVADGLVVAMTTQTLAGAVDPFVYSTGRELERAGVLYLADLLPEVAYVKMLWALGRSTDPAEVRRLLREDRAGEFEPRRPLEAGP